MKICAVGVIAFLMCIGCSERESDTKIVSVDKYAFDSITRLRVGEAIGGTCQDATSDDIAEEINGICDRIKNLDITFITPGAGISIDSYRLMMWIIEKYNIDIPNSAITNNGAFFCSDTEEKRLKYFEEAIYAKHKIIWAIRGGFGSNMIIGDLNRMPIPIIKKSLVGFSDTTSLNLFVSQKWGWRAIHAPVLIHLAKKDFSVEKFDTLLDILEGKIDSYEIKEVYPLNKSAKTQKKVTGSLTGGNLTVVELSIGTCWEIETGNKILFLEDINLNPWRIYRSLYHLKESHKIDNARAIVFGRFVNGGTQKEIMQALQKFAEIIDIPVYVTNQFGHGNNNKPLVYNATATISDKKMNIKL